MKLVSRLLWPAGRAGFTPYPGTVPEP